MNFNYSTKSNLLALLVVIHLLFFSIKVYLGNFFLQDSLEYYQLAENIKNHLSFYSGDFYAEINLENYTKRPPLYGLFILIFSFFLKSKLTVLIAQNILSIIGIRLVIRMFKKYVTNINIILYTVLIISSINQFVYTNYLMSEILFQFLLILLCYTFHKTIQTKSLSFLIYNQIIIALLFLTKPIFYLFIIPNIVICIWLTNRILKKAYLLSLIPIITLLLYITWNEKRTGSYEFSSIQNLSLKNFNLKYFHINKYGLDYAMKVNDEISKEADTQNNYKERQHYVKTKSIQYLKKDLFSYTWFHIKGGLRMLIDPGRFDIYNFFNFENKNEVGFLSHINQGGIHGAFNYFKQQPLIILIILPLILILNFIKVIGFSLYLIKYPKSVSPFLIYTLLIIIYIVFLTGPLGASRFLVPIIPFYCMFASLGLSKKQIQLD